MLSVIIPNAIEIEAPIEVGFSISTFPGSLSAPAFSVVWALSIVWLWVVYRLIRGAIRLSDGLAAPGRAAP